MSEEPKKAAKKIDLKSRFGTKTVKGLTPGPNAAIPPPPDAKVPAPPAELMGPAKPKIVADANDLLGPATIEGGTPESQQQQIIVVGDQGNASPATKAGVLYALIVVGLLVGIGGGYMIGSNKEKSEVKNKALTDAKDLQDKVAKANDALAKFLEVLKQAQNEISKNQSLEQPTIDQIKAASFNFGSNDLKERKIDFFGPDTAGKLYVYANKIATIEELKAILTRGSALEGLNKRIKDLTVPASKSRYGITLAKPPPLPPEEKKDEKKKDDKPDDKKKDEKPAAPQVTIASLVDFGETFDLKEKVDNKTGKLKVKEREFEVWPVPSDPKAEFMSKTFMSVLDTKTFLALCPIRAHTIGLAERQINELILTIEGSGDEKGTLTPGKELADKLKTLIK